MSVLTVPLRRNEPLARYTTFGIGGTADWFFEPRTVAELSEACRMAHSLCTEVRILGGGSNLLISDAGVRGAVISMRRFETRLIEPIAATMVRVSAGVRLARLVRHCAKHGLAGLECLAGIPGTVGGAIAMNAGGIGGTIGSLVAWLDVMHPDGAMRRLSAEEVAWGYRSTNLGELVVVFAGLRLTPRPVEEVVAQLERTLSCKRTAQPLTMPSAGCFFRNPAGDYAGRLVDQAGLKGHRVGGAMVSRKHANFLVNRGGATARDVLELVRQVRRAVLERFHVELQNEVHCWV